MPHADRRVVAFTPYGRERTVSILYPYLRREQEQGVLDEWMLWMNTDADQESDRAYARALAGRHPWIKIVERPANDEYHFHKQMYTRLFYVHCTDPDAVYLRFDDDIVYVHDLAVRRMVEQKAARPDTLGLFPIIINNAICSWHLQQRGAIPADFGQVGSPFCMDPVGWADPGFAEKLHRMVLDRIRADTVEEMFMYQDVPLAPQQQFSVSCFAVAGSDYAALTPPGVLDFYEEEHWLTVHRPGVVGKTNAILADALVSHFTFYPQRDHINGTDILDQYRALAESL
jgi:hypothetical protein